MESNYNAYLLGMEKSNADKLFFLNYLCLDDYDYIVDFGCGRGDIIKTCSQMTKAICYGIERDPIMKNIAGDNCKDTEIIFLEKLSELRITPKQNRVLFIFSSVVHKLGNLWWDEVYPFIKKYAYPTTAGYEGCTVVIRDMYFGGSFYEEVNQLDLARIVMNSNNKVLGEFIAKYGMDTKMQMYHYLLKYSYVDNWETELEEDYFSFDWESFLAKGDTEIVYDRKYILPFKKERVKHDFGIELEYPTHRQLIVNL